MSVEHENQIKNLVMQLQACKEELMDRNTLILNFRMHVANLNTEFNDMKAEFEQVKKELEEFKAVKEPTSWQDDQHKVANLK